MRRNMSFHFTRESFENRTQTVTRRQGWDDLKPGEILRAVNKIGGLKVGEKVKELGWIKIISVDNEPVYKISDKDCISEGREGHPELSSRQYIRQYCRHNRCEPSDVSQRITFVHLDTENASLDERMAFNASSDDYNLTCYGRTQEEADAKLEKSIRTRRNSGLLPTRYNGSIK